MIFLEILLGVLVFFYYLKFSIGSLRVENYKKGLGFHIITAFFFGNLFLSLFPAIMGKTVNSISEFSGLFWLEHIPVLNDLLTAYPIMFFIISASIGLSALIMCFVTIYNIFFEY